MAEFVITMVIIGAIAGYAARLIVPGRDPMGFLKTVLLGVIGSFAGGFLGYALLGEDVGEGPLQTSGIIGSIIGTVLVLLIYRAGVRRAGWRGWLARRL